MSAKKPPKELWHGTVNGRTFHTFHWGPKDKGPTRADFEAGGWVFYRYTLVKPATTAKPCNAGPECSVCEAQRFAAAKPKRKGKK